MIYLASAYSHPDEEVMERRYLEVAEVAAHLTFVRNEIVYSPIVYGHQLAKQFSLPTNAASWERLNLAFLRRADKLYVLQNDGWERSVGVAQEIDFARKCLIPIHFINCFGEPVL